MRRILLILGICLAACSYRTPVARTQAATATLDGTVVDEKGGAVPGVQVTVLNTATGQKRQVTTDNQGFFSVPLLPPGHYTVRAEHEGFAVAETREVILHVGDQVVLPVTLKVGTVNQTLTVEGGAPLLNTENATVATVVDRQLVENIPLNGRSFQTLMLLTPGVTLTGANYSEQGQFSVNGQRQASNYFMIDGVSANVGVEAGFGTGQSVGGALPGFTVAGGTNSLVSVDAMQEFQIQTSTFAPEFGRMPGGQISIVTRSGTNQFHGTAFDYFRNDILDANNWFNDAADLPKPAERQNDFGGVLGGPILKDRTFFFFSYEGLRLRQPQTALETVPTVSSRNAAVATVQPLFDAYPLPNGTDYGNGTAEFTGTFSAPGTLNATSIRIDHTLTKSLVIFGRYNYAPSNSKVRGEYGTLSEVDTVAGGVQTLTLGADWTVSKNASDAFRFNYSRSHGSSTSVLDNFGGATPPPNSLLFPPGSAPRSEFFFEISNFGFSSAGVNAANSQNQLNFTDNYSFLAGPHHVKLGVDIRRTSTLSNPRNYDAGFYWFDLPTALTGISPYAFVDAYKSVRLADYNYSVYAQDTWRVSQRLTLTYGLRWDINPAPSAENGLSLLAFQSLSNLTDLSTAPLGTPVYNTTYHNFAPRAGIAYQVIQHGGWETVVRGGWGVFYDLGTGDIGFASIGPPFGATNNFSGEPFPFTAQQAAPPAISAAPPYTGEVVAANPDLQLPRTYEWNVAVEQSLGAAQTLTVSYVGAIGRQLIRTDYASGVSPEFPSYVGIMNNGGNSSYNALQAQFRRRLSRGLEVLASYTYAHAIDTSSVDDFGTISNTLITNSNDNRGSSDFDIRHNFSGAVTYNVPVPHWGSAAKAVLGNWAADGIFTARSAPPLDLTTGQSFAITSHVSSYNVRPDLVPGQPLYLSDPSAPGGRRLNPAAFTNVPADVNGFAIRQGTLGRNVLRGFGETQLDFGVHRQFNLTERLGLRFQAEFFNLFNHPNFGSVNNCTCDYPGLFGQATTLLANSLGTGGLQAGFNPLYQIGGPRSIQLALKLIF